MNITLILSDEWIKASNEFNEYARQINMYGFYKRINTKQQEQQGSYKQGSVSLKDSGKVLKRNGYTTLLSIAKGSDLLQDKTMRVSGKRTQGIGPALWAIEDRVSGKIWNTLRKANEV